MDHQSFLCPWCGTAVRVSSEHRREFCVDCNRTYETERSLPILLAEAWVRPDTDWD